MARIIPPPRQKTQIPYPEVGVFRYLKSKMAPRKQVYVNGRIQGRFAVRMGTYWLVYHFALWQSLFVYRYIQYRLSMFDEGQMLTFGELYGKFWTDFSPMLLCAGVLLPIFLWDMIKLTHRVAGPLVRFQHVLNDLIAGKQVRSVVLRKGDMLTEFQDAFNKFLVHYEELRTRAEGQSDVATADSLPGPALTSSQERLLVEIMGESSDHLNDTHEFQMAELAAAGNTTNHVLAHHFSAIEATR